MKKTLFWALLAVVFCACSKDEEVSDAMVPNSISLKFGETVSLGTRGSFEVDNPFVAAYSNSTIKGVHVGQTIGTFNGSKRVSIEVLPSINYLNYPLTCWGETMQTVASKHRGGEKMPSTSSDGLVYNVYSGSKSRYTYIYLFDTKGALYGAALYVPTTEVEALVEWISQKYYMFKTDDAQFFSGGIDAYTHRDATTIVGVTAERMSTTKYVSQYAYMLVFSSVETRLSQSTNGERINGCENPYTIEDIRKSCDMHWQKCQRSANLQFE